MNRFEKLAHNSYKAFSKALKQSANTLKRIERNPLLKWSVPKVLSQKFHQELDRLESHWPSKHFREASHSGLLAKASLEMIHLRMAQSKLRGILNRQSSVRALAREIQSLPALWGECEIQTEAWSADLAVGELKHSASKVYANQDGVPWTTYREKGWLQEITPHPLFDLRWYREKYQLEPDVDPFSHFMSKGWAEGLMPYENFDFQDFYQQVQPLLAERGINPLVLYHQQKDFRELYGDALVTYQKWVKWMEKRHQEGSRASNPSLVSLVFMGATLPETWLQSILTQSHSHWELWCPQELALEGNLDSRIRCFSDWTILHRELQGKYLIHVDETTFLHPRALEEIVSAFEAYPQAKIIYSDEDRIWEGERRDPYFKPDFSMDLLRSHFYLGKVLAFDRAAWLQLGVSSSRVTEEDLWSRALRAGNEFGYGHIFHIPQVLWSKVLDPKASEKPLPSSIVEAHLEEAKIPASVEVQERGKLRIRYAIPASPPLVSVIIPTRNGLHFLERCVKSLLEKTTYPSYEVLVVDNQSDDPACLHWMEQIQREISRVKVLRYAHAFNYSAINNFAVKHAKGEVIVLLNNDTEVIGADWMREMVSLAVRPDVGCVGALLLYPNDTIQHAGVVLGVGGVANHAFLNEPAQSSGYQDRLRVISEYDAVTAACLAVRKSVFEEVGGLDQEHLAVAFNDVDFCLRVSEAGYKNLVTPFAKLYHHESVSRGAEDTPEKYARFKSEVAYMLARWKKRIADRRCYSPHLSLHPLKSFRMAWPPQEMDTKKADP